PLQFTKTSGAGNDFIIIDARAPGLDKVLREEYGINSRAEFAKLLCRRGHGIGADGVVLVENAQDADFSWDFFNSDGSHAEMCGNAARCVARFAHAKGIAKSEMRFKTAAGIVKAKILDGGGVQVMMLPPRLVEKDLPVLVDSGVPHAVIKETKLNDTRKLRETALANRYPKKAGPRGSNVTFYAPTGPAKIVAISFERGVEDFTLACGTGAMAAAYAAKLEQPAQNVFEVRMPGGRLEVEFPADQNVVLLRGPAQLIAEGIVLKEALNEII
ncbi:MAG TPA: diaminopimelate epimerase, partial [Bdellovibrionales bacterium]|nr:diaminopimelate epimerase [Bdellovibrionales bacterium]